MKGTERGASLMNERQMALLLIFVLVTSLHTPSPLSEPSQSAESAARTATLDILMLGNSYTSNNQLNIRVENLLNAAGHNSDVEVLTSGGKTLAWHGDEAAKSGTQWNTSLAQRHDYVILQDQSQVPGFPTSSTYWQDSLDGAEYIDSRVEAKGGDTIFLQTWGYRFGDENNQWRYPDYPTMHSHLRDGYLMYAHNLSTSQRPVFIAPVGEAFAFIYDDTANSTANGTPFSALYASDDKHPSIQGTYLAACVIHVTITGQPSVGLPSTGGINASRTLLLQQAADHVVLNRTAYWDFPWEFDMDDVTFGVESGSIFNIDPGATIGIGVNFTNREEMDTTALVDVSGPVDWTLSWSNPTTPEVGHSYDAPSDETQWLQFSIEAPIVDGGIPLAGSLHDFSVHLVGDSDGAEDWYNFSMRYGTSNGIELVEGGGDASIEPGGIVNLKVFVKNIGNTPNSLGINMAPLDENGNQIGTAGHSFAHDGWTAIIYDRSSLEDMAPDETAMVRLQVESPFLSSGFLMMEIQIWAQGVQEVETFTQSVIIVPRSGAALGITDVDCRFDTAPGETCMVDLFIENTGDAGFLFNLSIVEMPDWLSVNIADYTRFLGPGQTVHGIEVEVLLDSGLAAGLAGGVTIEVEVDGWVPAEVSFDVAVAAVHSWQLMRSDAEVIDGRLTAYWEMMNTGNGADGLVVSVDCNVFTDFGVITTTGTPSENIGDETRSFQILDVPEGTSVIFEVWMDVPEQAPIETEAILTVEARSIRDPSVIFNVDHSATIAGAPGSESTGPSEDEPSAFTKFIQTWLETILILAISVIGSVGLVLAILHRIEKERGWHRRNNPEDTVEEPKEWLTKFEGGGEEAPEIIESPTTDVASFRAEFIEKSGDHSRIAEPAPDQNAIESAGEVLEEALVEDAILDAIEIADAMQEDDLIHPDNLILDLDDFNDRLDNLGKELRDDEDP